MKYISAFSLVLIAWLTACGDEIIEPGTAALTGVGPSRVTCPGAVTGNGTAMGDTEHFADIAAAQLAFADACGKCPSICDCSGPTSSEPDCSQFDDVSGDGDGNGLSDDWEAACAESFEPWQCEGDGGSPPPAAGISPWLCNEVIGAQCE